jgi:prevent-host-death family protein
VKELDSAEARENWGDTLDYAQFKGSILVRRRGKPAAVIVGHEEWERIMKKIRSHEGEQAECDQE